MKTAIYPGTFDPMTIGHVNVVRRAATLFGEVIVAVAESKGKKTLFTLSERVEIARASTADIAGVRVLPFTGLLKDCIAVTGANVIVRGMRSGLDFEQEYALAGMNRLLMPRVDTVLLPNDEGLRAVSSTFVRELLTLGHQEAYDFVAELARPVVERYIAPKIA